MPKANLSQVRRFLIYIFLVSTIFGSGYALGARGYLINTQGMPKLTLSREVPEKDLDFSLFWRVWDTMHASYFDKGKINDVNMVYGAIRGMVEAVSDPYTVFLPPNENKVTEEDLHGNFEGVGIQIGFRGTQLAVVAPLPGSPAEKAGIKAGDYIIGIKDEKKGIDMGTVGINLPDAVKAIRGPSGSRVTLALTREGEDKPIVTEIVREKIDVPSVTLSYVGTNGSIAHIRLLKFGAETSNEWKKAINEILAKQNINSVILDLRNNPGGYLNAAVELAGEFVERGSVAVIEEEASGIKQELKTTTTGKLVNKKVVVLINKGSASASEILAGALRDNRKIKLIGDTSFGKGTVQEPQQLDNGSGLHITIARWLTPSGYWVNEKGLEPDIKVQDDPNTENDEQLDAAISQL